MRTICIIAILGALLFTGSLFSQSFKMGTIAADAGFGFGMYGVKAYSPINNTTHTGIGIIGTLPAVDAEFGLLRLIGVGIHYRRGTYGSYSSGKIRGNDLCGMVNIHLANKKDKFDLVLGAGYGLSSMRTTANTTESFIAKGGILRVQVAPHLYFGKYVGMFFRVAYNKHLLNNNIQIVDGSGKSWSEADGATWNMGGIEFNIGVAFKMDLLKKKEDK